MGIINQPCGKCDICGHIWLREQFSQDCEVCGRVVCQKHLASHRITLHRAAGLLDLAMIHVCSECLENSLPERDMDGSGMMVVKSRGGVPFEEPGILDARQRLRKAVIEKLSMKFADRVKETADGE